VVSLCVSLKGPPTNYTDGDLPAIAGRPGEKENKVTQIAYSIFVDNSLSRFLQSHGRETHVALLPCFLIVFLLLYCISVLQLV